MDHFLCTPGRWKGSGEVSFSHSLERWPYTVQWTIQPHERGFMADQEVQVEGIPSMHNCYLIFFDEKNSFTVTVTNETLGTFSGRGLVRSTTIAWEFSHPGQLEGLEVYERLSDSEYVFHSEYSGGDGYITKISGSMIEEAL